MNALFADTSYFIALVNNRDVHHAVADDFARNFAGVVMTTHWVLLELANYFANSTRRQMAAQLIESVLSDHRALCIEANGRSLFHGLALYKKRLDKSWSLTDCISFNVMRERQIEEALSSDHHFEQAGFHILLK